MAYIVNHLIAKIRASTQLPRPNYSLDKSLRLANWNLLGRYAKTKKMVYTLIASCLLVACNLVDDYVLGKDNTPKPAVLIPIKSKLNWVKQWSTHVAKANKTNTFLKLKPVVVDNIIYVASEKGLVQAINPSNGHLLWSKQLKDGLVSGPSIKKGRIALGTNSSGVVLLRQSNGELVWQASLSGDALAKPIINDNDVIVKTIDGNVYALNLSTGKTRWVVDHGSPSLILRASSVPLVYQNAVLSGFSDGKLDAIDLQSGAMIWQRSVAYANGASDVERLVDIDADPIIRGNVVYLGTYQGYIGAMSLDDGQFIWTKPASIYKNMAIDSHALYASDSHDVLWAFNRTNGQVIWKQFAFKGRGLTEPVIYGDNLIVGDSMGILHLVSTKTGELVGRISLDSSIDITPTVAKNKVYVMTRNGQLYQLSVRA